MVERYLSWNKAEVVATVLGVTAWFAIFGSPSGLAQWSGVPLGILVGHVGARWLFDD